MRDIDKTKQCQVTNDRYRQTFHIMTDGGWLNDPNGLCYFKGYYHVFYQFHPYSAEWGPMHWGHVRSRDLIHWEQLPVALVPGDPEDEGGCFSGSAIVKDDRLYLLYTGHHYYGDGDPDHFWENQNLAYSDDGIHFTKSSANPIIEAPEDNTQHFRDPKVWEHDGHYWLVVGSQSQINHCGRILLYESADLINWVPRGPIANAQDIAHEGFMWECPDFFTLDGQDVVVCSPQGLKATGHHFLNQFQSCTLIGKLDYQAARFSHGPFWEIDHGHNFYAPQSFLTPDGRRILIGWFSPFDQPMPEKTDGWAGCLTIPRELHVRNGQVQMIPAREVTGLRQAKEIDHDLTLTQSQSLPLTDPSHNEQLLTLNLAPNASFTWQLVSNDKPVLTFHADQASGDLVLTRGQSEQRFAKFSGQRLTLQIFVDTSSVEIFVNHGEATFTSRYYCTGKQNIILSANTTLTGHVTAYQLA